MKAIPYSRLSMFRTLLLIVVLIVGYKLVQRWQDPSAARNPSVAAAANGNPVYRNRDTNELRAELQAKEQLLQDWKAKVTNFHGTHRCGSRVSEIHVEVSPETQRQIAQIESDVQALREELNSR